MYGNENERKKRGIIVPVVTLAVCAIAMVGLGFAISSSVVSDNNAVEELMIDMSADKAYFGTDGAGKKIPGNGVVDGILKLEIYNNKKTKIENGVAVVDPGIEATGGFAYMKIYGNIADVTLKASCVQEGVPANVGITLTLYDVSGTTLKKVASSTLTGDGAFSVEEGETIQCDTIYGVAVTSLDGSQFTYGIDGKIQSFTLNGAMSVTGVNYTFTATPTPKTTATV